jgi:ATP-dependent Clp protease ATP-binding subunit ClpC
MKGRNLGFAEAKGTIGGIDTAKMKATVLEEANKAFRPEFINRVDEIIVFNPLGKEELLKIVDIMLNEVKLRTLECDITLDVDEEAKKLLLERGYDPKYGARPLRRAIQKMLEDSLSNLMLEGTVKAGEKILVTVADGELKFDKVKSKSKK